MSLLRQGLFGFGELSILALRKEDNCVAEMKMTGFHHSTLAFALFCFVEGKRV